LKRLFQAASRSLEESHRSFDFDLLTELIQVAQATEQTSLDLCDFLIYDLNPLSELSNLQWLKCDNTQVSELAKADLKKSLPKLKIYS